MEKRTIKLGMLKIYAYIGETSKFYGSAVFFWRQEFSFPQFFMTHPFSTHLSYPLKFPLQRIKKAFFIIFFLQFTRAPLLSGRNNVSFSTGIDYKFLLCAELHWPLVDTCHNYVSYRSFLNSLTVTLYHIF